MRGFYITFAASLAFASTVSGDELVLHSGGRVSGALQNPDRSSSDAYVLATEFGGTISVSPQDVDRVVAESETLRKYRLARAVMPDTEEAHSRMAEDCRKAGLSEQREFHLEQIVRHNPDHTEARHALGFSRVDGKWMRQDDWMLRQGYRRYRGSWKLPEEIAIRETRDKYDADVAIWRKQLRTWRSWIVKPRDKAGVAQAEIRAIRDPLAAPALISLLNEDREPYPLRQLYVEVLSQLPSGEAISALARHAVHDNDRRIREACLDLLERTTPPLAQSIFVSGLQHKQNYVVNRSALALGRFKSASATLPLINALITEHKHVINRGGGIQTGFNSQGGGGLSAGSKKEVRKVKQQNEAVLHALTAIHDGTNFGFNQLAWKNWYLTHKAPVPVDLRRGD